MQIFLCFTFLFLFSFFFIISNLKSHVPLCVVLVNLSNSTRYGVEKNVYLLHMKEEPGAVSPLDTIISNMSAG